MPRPIKARTVKSYSRDIETLGRLRLAIYLDRSVSSELSTQALSQIDAFMGTLIKIIQATDESPA